MNKLSQESLLLQVSKIGKLSFVATSLRGREGMSEPFQFAVQLASEELNIDCKDVLGKNVAFTLFPDADHPRQIHGRILNFVADRVVSLGETEVRFYEADVVPWWWLTKYQSNCRVFQEKTGPQIIEQVLKDGGFTDYKLALQGTYAKEEYCVQYQESDYAFASRLMEHYGIFYYFTHEEQKHTMVLGDAVSAYRNAVVDEASYVDSEDHPVGKINFWRRRSSVVPSKVSLADYYFETPAKALVVDEKTKGTDHQLKGAEIYDFPGAFAKAAEGKSLVVARVEQFESSAVVISGGSGIPTASPGQKFKLANHPVPAECQQKYAFLTVDHHAEQSIHNAASLVEDVAEFYSNQFECIPADVPARPPRHTPRPLMTGPHSAKVVGPKQAEIHTDKYGRVKIQFPWDREGKYDDKSSCFVRVAQSWAGNKRGALYTPRVGDEVLVEFMNGDPDRPIITGSVYNAENMPPWDPVQKSTISGLKTLSTDKGKAKNFNELHFDDKIGKEKVYFHAERDFVRIVENNDELKIGFDGKDKGNQTIDIYNDRTITIDKGIDTLTIKSGDRKMDIDKGSHFVTIDQGDQKIAINAGLQSTEAARSITFKVGTSSIKMDPGGITLQGNKITLKADLNAEIEGGVNAQIKGTCVDVKASGILTVKGSMVKIN